LPEKHPHKRLSDAYVVTLKEPPRGRLEITDAVIPELKLRVTDEGHKSFSLRFSFNGERGCRLTLGEFGRDPDREPGKLNIKKARDAARAALGQIALGIDPREMKRAAKRAAKSTPSPSGATDGSVAWAVENWLAEALGPKKKPWRPKTLQGHRQVMRHDVLSRWGTRPLATITKRDVEALVDEVAARAPVQANKVQLRLQRFFNWAVKRGLIDISPATDTEKPTHEQGRERALSPRELAAFWRASTATSWPFGPLLHLLALTAQRRDTVRTMAWGEIDFERRRWEIPAAKMKGGRSHIVHLADAALEILRALPRLEGSSLVFSTTGTTAVSGFSRATDRVRAAMAKELGKIEPFVLHDLRRSFATIAAEELKIAPHVIDKVLAHSTMTGLSAVARVYQRAEFLEERAAALEAWGRYITHLIEPTADNVVELPRR
jgi:integrase